MNQALLKGRTGPGVIPRPVFFYPAVWNWQIWSVGLF